MRRPLIVTSSIAAAVFVSGYAAGQIFGIGSSAAASAPARTARVAPFAFRHGPFAFRHSLGTPPPGMSLGPRADGTVSAVSGNSITVKPDGDKGPSPSNEYDKVTTITVDSSTTYMAGPGTTGSLSDVKAGTFVIAFGTVSSDGTTLSATKVLILDGQHAPGMGGPPPSIGRYPPAGTAAPAGPWR